MKGPDGRTYEQKLDQLNRREEARARHAALPPVERRFGYEIETHHRKHNWSVERDALLKRIRRGMAVMVLKAFPLDYEGEVTAENRPVFERRQRALIRLYQRRIRFEPVPHKALADQGWMLRLFNEGARPDANDRPRTPATKKRQTRSTVLLLGRR